MPEQLTVDEQGQVQEPSRGNIPTRHNNPLNIKIGPATAHWVDEGLATVGEAARDGGRFLKFNTPETGFAAAHELLAGPVYSGLSVDAALKKWSGGGYGEEASGLPTGLRMQDLSPTQRQGLVGAMAKREGFGGPATGPGLAAGPGIIPFNEIARQLDPMMAEEDYSKVQDSYFLNTIAPRLGENVDVQAAWKQFRDATKRPPLMTPMQRLGAQVHLGLRAAGQAMVEPFSFIPPIGEALQADKDSAIDKGLVTALRREGASTAIPGGVGTLLGGGIPFVAAIEAAGPLAAAATVGRVAEAGKALQFANRTLRGGLAFSAYEAGREQEGSRLLAGLKGFGAGVGFEGLLSLPKLLGRAAVPGVSGAVQDAVGKGLEERVQTGQPLPGPADAAGAAWVAGQRTIARAEGRPLEITPNDNLKGVVIAATDRMGNQRTMSIAKGSERQTVDELQRMLSDGGSLDTVGYHPQSAESLGTFMQLLAERSQGKYEFGQRVLHTPGGNAEAVVAKAEGEGLNAHAPDPQTVIVEAPDIVADVRSRAPLMTRERAADFIRAMGADPEKADLELAQRLKPEEIQMLMKAGPGQTKPSVLDKPSGLPEWASQEIDERFKRAQELGIVGDIESLSAERLTAKQVVQRLGARLPREIGIFAQMDAESLVRVVRNKLGIPSMDDTTEFERWLQTRTAGRSAEIEAVRAAEEARGMPEAPGVFEERIRKGEVKLASPIYDPARPIAEQVGAIVTPTEPTGPGETFYPKAAPMPPETVRLRIRPQAAQMVVPSGYFQERWSGAYGVQFDRVQGLLGALGVRAPAGMRDTLPGILVEKGASRSTIWHELNHAGLTNIVYNFQRAFEGLFAAGERKSTLNTIFQIAKAFEFQPGYSRMSFETRLNEAFTHAAEAIRFGNQKKLAVLAGMDTDTVAVIGMVNRMGINIRDHIASIKDSAPARIMDRRMEDIIRRTDPNVTYQLRQAARWQQPAFWDEGVWKRVGEDGTVHQYENDARLWDALEQEDKGRFLEPALSAPLEERGVRGPILPGGITPSGNRLPMPNNPIDPQRNLLGWTALAGVWQPIHSWVADAHVAMNRILQARGEYLPLYDRWKAVDDAVQASRAWFVGQRDRVGKILEGTPKAKLMDYFEALIGTPTQYIKETLPSGLERVIGRRAGVLAPEKIAALKLTPQDVEKVQKMHQWLIDFQDDTKINAIDYLNRWLPKLRGAAYNPGSVWGRSMQGTEGFWEDAVRNARAFFNPEDNHVGRFADWLIKEGMDRKFTKEPLAALESLVNKKTADGTFIMGPARWPMTRYVNTIKNMPDISQQVMNSAMRTFTDFLAQKGKALNEHLPEGLKVAPESYSAPTALLSKLMQFSYAANVGAKPANVLRDFFQLFLTTYPIYGMKTFGGIARGLTSEGWTLAKNAGALMDKGNVGDAYVDIFHNLPVEQTRSTMTRIANTLLAPARWGNNVARSMTYHTAYDAFADTLPKLRGGAMDQGTFLTESGLYAHKEPVIARVLAKAVDPKVPIDSVAREGALHMVDLTQWPYRRGTSPALMQTGVGRVFGQYGTWPLNYIDFLKTQAGKAASPAFRGPALASAARWVAVNWAASHVMEDVMGVDSSNWLWFSPTGFSGGPNLQMVQNLGQAGEAGPRGREARRAVINQLTYGYMPAATQVHNVLRMLDKGIDPMSPDGFKTMLGFRPLHELEQDRDILEWLQYEAGFPTRERR